MATVGTPREARLERIAELLKELERPPESWRSRVLKTVLTTILIGIGLAILQPLSDRLPEMLAFILNAALTVGCVSLISSLWPRFRDLNIALRVLVGIASVWILWDVRAGLRYLMLSPEKKAAAHERKEKRAAQNKKAGTLLEQMRMANLGGFAEIEVKGFPTEGKNWRFLIEGDHYRRHTQSDARVACGVLGREWSVPSKEELAQATPFPTVPKTFYVWIAGDRLAVQLNSGRAAGDIVPGELNVFASSEHADYVRPTLCFKKADPEPK